MFIRNINNSIDKDELLYRLGLDGLTTAEINTYDTDNGYFIVEANICYFDKGNIINLSLKGTAYYDSEYIGIGLPIIKTAEKIPNITKEEYPKSYQIIEYFYSDIYEEYSFYILEKGRYVFKYVKTQLY